MSPLAPAPAIRRPAGRLARALLAFVLAAGPASARDSVLFERIGDEERIPDGVVTALAQDGRGFLWIGTPEALIRHDGYRFRRYVRDPADPGSLPGNRIVTLQVGRDGRLWIGLQGEGVAVYDPDRDRFARIPIEDAVGQSMPGVQVRAIAETPDGSVWIGTTGRGLLSLDPSGRLVVHRHSTTAGALPDDRVTALAVDRSGTLWVGTWRGLARWRAETGIFEPVLSEAGDAMGFAQSTVRGLYVARNGNLWVGAQQGLVAMIPAEHLGRDPPPDPGSVRRWRANGFFVAAEPEPGSVWLGHAVGIDVFSADGAGKPFPIRHETMDPLSLANAEVRGLVVDRGGFVWVGTFGGGLQRANPVNHAFVSRRFEPTTDRPLTHLNATVVAAARDGGLWAGTAQQGLVRFDAALRLVEFIPSGDGAGELPGRYPSALAETADGDLWVGTEAGLHVRRADRQGFETLSGEAFPEGTAVRRVFARPDGQLWVATADGVFEVGRDRRVRALLDGAGRRTTGIFNAVIADPAGGGWAGGTEGLFRITADGVLEPVVLENDGRASRATIQGLLIDRQGEFWIDADGLLRVRQRAGGRFEVEAISRRHGYGEVAFGANLLDDADGRIWTHRFVYDPVRDLLLRLGRADGVLVGTGWFRAYARLADGRLAFGATEGILVVDPARFAPMPDDPLMAFTELKVDGRIRPIGARPGTIELGPDESNVAIEFAALDFAAPASRRYRYRLEGVDRDWIVVDAESRTASYGGLWPGNYRFTVQGSRRTGGWGHDVLTLDLRVTPSWWQTPTGLIALIGGATVLVLLWVWRRERGLERAKQRLEREVASRTAELRGLSEELARRNADLRQATLTDPLTGLRNRRYLMQELRAELRQALGRGEPDAASGYVFFLIDIDRFKAVNDRHGHAAGDVLIRLFAERLRQVFRAGDDLIRWGGEEFLVVARGLSFDAAASLAERARERVAAEPFRLDEDVIVSRTCSIGFAPFPFDRTRPRAHGWESVVELADRALLAAKELGRNAWIGLRAASPAVASAGPADERAVAGLRAAGFEVRVSSGIDGRAAAERLATPGPMPDRSGATGTV